MAVTILPYNHTTAKVLTLDIDASATYFYLELLSNSANFVSTHITKDNVEVAVVTADRGFHVLPEVEVEALIAAAVADAQADAAL
jgi:hypothetical protein